jgi:hypothetical protein
MSEKVNNFAKDIYMCCDMLLLIRIESHTLTCQEMGLAMNVSYFLSSMCKFIFFQRNLKEAEDF